MTDKKKYVYDIETLVSCIIYCFTPVEKEDTSVKTFILHKDLFQLDELVIFLKSNIYLISYNGLRFDGQVTQFILHYYRMWKGFQNNYTNEEIISEIYKFAQKTIALTNDRQFPVYPDWKFDVEHLDLFTIWHFDNVNKKTALKFLEFSMDWENLEEMPIDHTEAIDKTQIRSVVKYCINDIMATKAFYYITLGETELPLYKGVNKIQLREDIIKEYGLNKRAINFNDVAIGKELNLQSYLKMSGLKKKDELFALKHKCKPNLDFTFGDCIPEYVNFKTKKFQDFYNSVKDVKVDLTPKSSQFFKLEHNGTTYVIGQGGCHSADKPRMVTANDNKLLIEVDVGGQYPWALFKRKIHPKHLGPLWSEIIGNNIQVRTDAKRNYKKIKLGKYQSINECFKIANNGGSFGQLGELTSWMYDLFALCQCTIGNEFELLMLAEMMEESNIHSISANTDGLVLYYDKTLDKKQTEICKEWESIVGNTDIGQLERTDYSKLVQLTVNDYMAIKTNGEVKCKGDYMIDFEMHKNKSNRIVPLALKEYYVNGTDPETFIKEYIKQDPKHIFDFCACVRAKSDSYFEEREVGLVSGSLFEDVPPISMNTSVNGKRLQKTVRYYISTDGVKLMKCYNKPSKTGKKREAQVNAGALRATVFNQYTVKEDYKIDFNFYIEQVYSMINKLDKNIHL